MGTTYTASVKSARHSQYVNRLVGHCDPLRSGLACKLMTGLVQPSGQRSKCREMTYF